MLESINGSGRATTYLPPSADAEAFAPATKLTLVMLPPIETISRNAHPFSPHVIMDSLVDMGLHSAALKATVQIHVIDKRVEEFMCTAAAAIAKSLPLYHSKSKRKRDEDETKTNPEAGANASFYNEKGDAVAADSPLWKTAGAVARGVRLSAKLGDTPPAELDPASYAEICRRAAEDLGDAVAYEEIAGEDLRRGGYGGIFGVGMAAARPPRMVVMTYVPEGGEWEEHVALCGKGVVYDTGGLALKPKVGMCGMKHDMGGSAGVLGGFQAAVQLKLPQKITLVLAIVENAIGNAAVRNDDILTMKSGKTVEINNTDAEGRLILADCVSHASTSIGKVNVILDMATLTGAVSITTGKKHAGILAKTKEMEERIYEAGMRTGDLVYPMLYLPELLEVEFGSKVADMKNSVKDRGNAQASCAGHFIESHIDEGYEGDWVHVDMAAPDSKNDRATGYGVALVLGLLKAPGFC